LFKEFHLTLPQPARRMRCMGSVSPINWDARQAPSTNFSYIFWHPSSNCAICALSILDDGAPPVPDSTLRQARYTTALALLAALRTISLVRYNGDLGPNIVDIVLSMAVFIGQHEGRPFTAHKLAQYLRMPRPTVTRKLDRMVRGGVLERQGTKYSVRDEYLDRGEAIGMMRELAQIIYSACRFLPNLDNPELDIQKKPH
jgi:hypothetical protein